MQRRTPASGSNASTSANPVDRLALDDPVAVIKKEEEDDDVDRLLAPLNVDDLESGKTKSHARHTQRHSHWRNSPWAVGYVETSWMEERHRDDEHKRFRGPPVEPGELEPDSSGCLAASAWICPYFGADRVGNMVVLKSSYETVEETVVLDGKKKTETKRRPKLDCVVGPFWPMTALVTYPLILGVSAWTWWMGIYKAEPPKPIPIVLLWVVCTVGIVVALALTACRDPGVLHRRADEPPDGTWRWSDEAYSYKPRGSYYDRDTAVVVEGFDHV